MVKILSSVSVKINTGNFESVDFSKIVEVEFSPVEGKDVRTQISEKSAKLDALAVQLLKQEVEDGMKALGRERFDKGQQKRIPLWETLE